MLDRLEQRLAELAPCLDTRSLEGCGRWFGSRGLSWGLGGVLGCGCAPRGHGRAHDCRRGCRDLGSICCVVIIGLLRGSEVLREGGLEHGDNDRGIIAKGCTAQCLHHVGVEFTKPLHLILQVAVRV